MGSLPCLEDGLDVSVEGLPTEASQLEPIVDRVGLLQLHDLLGELEGGREEGGREGGREGGVKGGRKDRRKGGGVRGKEGEEGRKKGER